MHPSLDARLVVAALRMAPLNVARSNLSSFTPLAALSSPVAAYRKSLAKHGLTASMARKGNSYDNAFIESFWTSLKYEMVYHHRFGTLAEARSAIFHLHRTAL